MRITSHAVALRAVQNRAGGVVARAHNPLLRSAHGPVVRLQALPGQSAYSAPARRGALDAVLCNPQLDTFV